MELVSNQLWRTAGLAACVLLIAGEAAAGICIDVDLNFVGRDPIPVTVQSMQDEASAIWQRYGVQIQWSASPRDVQCPLVHGSFDVLVEYQASSAESVSGFIVLGRTHVAPAAIDRVGICVHYDETQHLLESMPGSRLFTLLGIPEVGPADIGRALGRVLAHEIGHVLLGAPRHQPWGLMRKWFAPDDLVARHRWAYTLSKKEIERLGLRERELSEYPQPGSFPSSGSSRGCTEAIN